MKFVSASLPLMSMYRTQGMPPREKPPEVPRFGEYCFKAVCYMKKKRDSDLIDVLSEKARFIGYDMDMESITSSVKRACRNYRDQQRNGKTYTCTEPEVTMMTSYIRRQCQGEVFFEFDSTVKKLL